MLNITTTAATATINLDEALRQGEMRCLAARKERAERLFEQAQTIIEGAENIPKSLSTVERLIDAMFARWKRIENGVPHPKDKYRDYNDELDITRSCISFIELERVASELAQAILEADLTTNQALCAVEDALGEVALRHPGW